MPIKEAVYFYIFPDIVPDKYGGNIPYQHSIVCLGEGLSQLGVGFFSNVNYWKTSVDKDEYLFNHDPETGPDDCSIVVINDRWFNGSLGSRNGYPMPEGLFKPGRKYLTVYLDHDDGACTYSWRPEFRQFDYILKAHFNNRIKYPSTNIYPTAFGLSTRIINATKDIAEFCRRKKRLLINFRVSHPSRTLVKKRFLPLLQDIIPVDESTNDLGEHPEDPYDYLLWKQTGKRHYPAYYDRLKESAACGCFGGYFITPYPGNQASIVTKAASLIFNRFCIDSGILAQFDSWRFWESLAAGCVTFHFEFEKYGMVLPVMPRNWEHYIGIDLKNIENTVKEIRKREDELGKISASGRKWALKHYSPKPTAERFLKLVLNNQLTYPLPSCLVKRHN